MLNNLVSNLKGYSSIAIFGFGKEGKSFYNFALKYLRDTKILIVDKNAPSDIKENEKLIFFSGENYLNGLDEAELIVKSPGISLYNLGIEDIKYNFTSTTELFMKYYKKQIIGVTGTKGKSTLVSILYKILENSNRDAVLCGNIGTPAFDILEEINEQTEIIMELSSHQLLNIKYSPHIAILTNLFQDHLDYYRSLEEYYDAKFNIMRFQNKDDLVILNLKEPYTELDKKIFQTSKVYNVSENNLELPIEFNMKNGFIHYSSLQILEKLVDILHVEKSIYLKTVNEFKTLAHRLEYVDTVDGVSFINDSISTIPEASIEAIKILKNVETLILGGFDRGIEYKYLVEFLLETDIRNIVLFSETGKIIYDKLRQKSNTLNLYYMNSLSESVAKVFEVTKIQGSVVLFSPAASSFDMYKNFIERGDEFKKLVREFRST